jgi:hypothetical protein
MPANRAPARPSPFFTVSPGFQRTVQHGDFLARHQLAAADAADAQAAEVARIIERAHLELQRAFDVALGLRNRAQDGLEQGTHRPAFAGAALRLRDVERGPALQRRGIHHRKVELVVVGAELVEEVERLIHDPLGTRAGAIDLVDDHDGLQSLLEGLHGDETRLRHGAFDRIDQEEHAVDHAEHALDLAAEVGVAGGVHDVDVVDRCIRSSSSWRGW